MEAQMEIEFLKKQLAAKNEELKESMLEVEKERREKKNLMRRNIILGRVLERTRKELEDVKQELEEKEEMEAFIRNEEAVESQESGSDFEVESGGTESEVDEDFPDDSGFNQVYRTLSPIPEEDPDEIPGYYDACIKYAASLKIVIGSDSKMCFCDELPKKPYGIEIKSEKENAGNKKKKGKKQFKLLFSLAHY